jgi:hypothetical protein
VANLSIPDFWGPVSNFGIPIAAVADTQKDPKMYVLPLCLLIVRAEANSITCCDRQLRSFVTDSLASGLR